VTAHEPKAGTIRPDPLFPIVPGRDTFAVFLDQSFVFTEHASHSSSHENAESRAVVGWTDSLRPGQMVSLLREYLLKAPRFDTLSVGGISASTGVPPTDSGFWTLSGG